MDVHHISWRGNEHPHWRPRGADRFGCFHLDLHDVIDPVLPRALEDLAHHSIDREHGILSRGRRSILSLPHVAPTDSLEATAKAKETPDINPESAMMHSWRALDMESEKLPNAGQAQPFIIGSTTPSTSKSCKARF